MLRKLRHKFIFINMLLVGVVLLVVVFGLLWYNMERLANQSINTMYTMLEWDANDARFRFELDVLHKDRRSQPQAALLPVFSVSLAEDGTVADYYSMDNVTVTDDLLAQAVEEVGKASSDSGVLHDLRLRYLVQKGKDGIVRIAFVDMSWEQDALMSMAFSALPVGSAALICLFVISFLLSTLALKPVTQVWEQQRQFVADASHELKTPITVILANAGILLSHPNDTVGSQQKWITFIQEEGARMRGLVEDMLFLAKNDAARQPLSHVPVQVSELVTGCVLLFEPVAFESSITLESTIEPNLSFCGDEGQLRRLVMILLDNAVKYSGANGKVQIRLCRVQEKVVLSVRNTGHPISPEHLPHIFERFYRADSARSRDRGGYGLGLAIAEAITRGHGGKITAESDSVRGTIFTAAFPVKSSRMRRFLRKWRWHRT